MQRGVANSFGVAGVHGRRYLITIRWSVCCKKRRYVRSHIVCVYNKSKLLYQHYLKLFIMTLLTFSDVVTICTDWLSRRRHILYLIDVLFNPSNVLCSDKDWFYIVSTIETRNELISVIVYQIFSILFCTIEKQTCTSFRRIQVSTVGKQIKRI